MKPVVSSATGGTAALPVAPPPHKPVIFVRPPVTPVAPPQAASLSVLNVEDSLVRWLKLQGIGKKPSTRHYHLEIERIIRADWPDLKTPIYEVSDAQCVQFAERIAHYSAPRYNGVVNAIRKIVPAAVVIPRRRPLTGNQLVPTPEEFARICAALDNAQQGHSGLVIRFLAHTGFRINEARQLCWEHVREDQISAPGTITKNGKPRCVPFIPGTAEVLRELRKHRKYHVGRNRFVLPQGRCYKALRYACLFLGLPRFTHHSFRHYFATCCITSGVDIPTVAKWLGHLDNGALLLRCYFHLLDAHSREMAPKVKVGGLPPPQLDGTSNVIELPVGLAARADESTAAVVPATGLETQAGDAGSVISKEATC